MNEVELRNNKDKKLLVINKDYCPEKDKIISSKLCSGCQYYVGFDKFYKQQCINCSF